jgi:hypothetical protein
MADGVVFSAFYVQVYMLFPEVSPMKQVVSPTKNPLFDAEQGANRFKNHQNELRH